MFFRYFHDIFQFGHELSHFSFQLVRGLLNTAGGSSHVLTVMQQFSCFMIKSNHSLAN